MHIWLEKYSMKINSTRINSQKWDEQEKHYGSLLARHNMLQEKAMHLASILHDTQNHTNDKSSLMFLLDASIGDNSETAMTLRRTIGDLLRTKISICKFSKI